MQGTKRPFPQPMRTNGRRLWPLDALLRWEGKEAEANALTSAENVYLTAQQVRARYGHVSDMWLWRQLRASEAAA
jgi:hypothetical protein